MGLLDGKKKFIDKGAISETRVIARFIQCGYSVFKPVSVYSRSDLIIEDAERRFWRVQVKTARWNIDRTGLNFNVVSNPGSRGRRGYKGECDYFAVYFEPTDGVYLVPVDEVSDYNCTLRLEPTPAKKRGDTRMAYDYEL